MKFNKLETDQSGIAHPGLLLFMILVLAVIGFAGYRVMNQDGSLSNPISSLTNKDNSNDSGKTVSDSVLNDSANLTEENQ